MDNQQRSWRAMPAIVGGILGAVYVGLLLNITAGAIDPIKVPAMLHWGWFGLAVYFPLYLIYISPAWGLLGISWHRAGSKARRVILYMVVAGCYLLAANSGIIWAWHRLAPHASTTAPEVDPLFLPYYKHYSEMLGKPQGTAVSTNETFTGATYQGWYEHAMVMYFAGTNGMYILFSDGSHSIRQNHNGFSVDLKWSDLSKRRRLFRNICPPPLMPAFGGFAVDMYYNKKSLGDVGCLVNHCVINEVSQVRFQQFAHGYMLGPYRRSHDDGTQEILIVIDGKDPIPETLPERKTLSCETPVGDSK